MNTNEHNKIAEFRHDSGLKVEYFFRRNNGGREEYYINVWAGSAGQFAGTFDFSFYTRNGMSLAANLLSAITSLTATRCDVDHEYFEDRPNRILEDWAESLAASNLTHDFRMWEEGEYPEFEKFLKFE